MDLPQEKRLFEAALALDPAERDAFLARNCPDSEDRERIQRLLAAQERLDREESHFLQSAIGSTPPGISIGPYRLLEKIGEGGMGEVFLAEQVEPVERRVAIKLLHAHFATEEARARFDLERRTLALLEHPNVARILDAGTAPSGQPYVVVEYVAGLPITQYCDKRRLPLDVRLSLFRDVCAGVLHAHQRGIIHRDLKPANVLVAEVDGVAIPKIIDFGIAKALALPSGGAGAHTGGARLIGTPDYMSPEQADLSPLEADTRADVFALGAILSELAVGELPYDRVPASGSALQIAQAIAARQPVRPSLRVSRDHARLQELAASRGSTARGLRARLAELDWVVLKAVATDRSRRYPSVADLAADVAHLERGEAVSAHPPDWRYLAGRWLRQHRLLAASAVVYVIALMGFGLLMAGQARELARERDRAAVQAESATRVARFLVDTLKAASPEQNLGTEPSARDLLDHASSRLGEAMRGAPAAQAELEHDFGEVYFLLGEYSVALQHFERAQAIHESGAVDDPRGHLAARRQVARTMAQLGRAADGERLTAAVLAAAQSLLAASDPLVVDATHDLAVAQHLQGRYAEALRLYLQVGRSREALLGAAHPATATAQTNAAAMHQLLGRAAESERIYLDVIAELSPGSRRRPSPAADRAAQPLDALCNAARLRQGGGAAARDPAPHAAHLRAGSPLHIERRRQSRGDPQQSGPSRGVAALQRSDRGKPRLEQRPEPSDDALLSSESCAEQGQARQA